MGDYSRSGADAAASGSLAIGAIARDVQEAQVRPRELEAATSLAESRAKVASLQVQEMQSMAGLEQEAKTTLAASGEAMNLHNGQKQLLSTYVQHGKWEAAGELQKKMNNQEGEIYATQTKAAEAEVNHKEAQVGILQGLQNIPDTQAYYNNVVNDAFQKAQENPTPENRQRAVQAQQAQAALTAAVNSGKPWAEIQKAYLQPAIEGNKSTLQKANELKASALAEDKAVQRAETERRDRESERLRTSEIAARKENQGLSKQLTLSVSTAKLAEDHDKYRNKLQERLDKLSEEAPEIPNPASHYYNTEPSKIPNPAIQKVQEAIDRSDKIHDDNLRGLEAASESGKRFVPKPYSDAGLAPKEVTVSGDSGKAKEAFGSYEPDKYTYGINPSTGKFARKPKG